MCTAVTYKAKDFYFGRTLDYEVSFSEAVTVTPRNYPFEFRHTGRTETHYAMIGMACAAFDYPLYYEAVNEKGLCIAGLNFVGNAVYNEPVDGMDNIAQFELIPWILSGCSCVDEVESIVKRLNIVNTPFNEELPIASLHWIVADKSRAITIESVKEGIMVYDNPVGVLTNNPPFDIQMFNLNNYMGLSSKSPKNTFSQDISLEDYSRGMGGLGLPGDLSSQSRFVRAAFVKMNSVSSDTESESVSQFFHILGAVDQQRGCCELENKEYEITLYASCCNADKGIYYYHTYDNHQISAVDMHREDMEGSELITYKPITDEQIKFMN